MLIQLGLLAFFGFMVYHPAGKRTFPNNDGVGSNRAFCMTAIGTLLLTVGVFVCAQVVDTSTEEHILEPVDDYEIRLYWLQQEQKVGDQLFDSYAIHPIASNKIYTMSRRRNQDKESRRVNEFTRLVREWRKSWLDFIEQYFLENRTEVFRVLLSPVGQVAKGSILMISEAMRLWVERNENIWAVIGSLTALSGFVVQFIGLRSMHTAATLAQLGAVGFVTLCRAWLRRGLAQRFNRQKLVRGHELDWLAFKLVRDACAPKNRSMDSGEASADVDGELSGDVSGILSASETHMAEPIQRLRRDMAKLATFKGTATKVAHDLTLAIEGGMQVLFPPTLPAARELLNWEISVARHMTTLKGLPKKASIGVNISLSKRGWKLRADDLDSIMSLWLYSHKERGRREREQQDKLQKTDQESFEQECPPEDTWIRGECPPMSIRILGPAGFRAKGSLGQDLEWWVPGGDLEIEQMQQSPSGEIRDIKGILRRFSSGRVVGYTDHWHQTTNGGVGPTASRRWSFDVDDSASTLAGDASELRPSSPAMLETHSNPRRSHHRQRGEDSNDSQKDVLTVSSSASLEMLFAEELIFSFMRWAASHEAVPALSDAHHQPVVKEDSACLSSWSKQIQDLVGHFQKLGFQSTQEVLLHIISPLSGSQKLPLCLELFDRVLRQVSETRVRSRGRFSESGSIYDSLFEQIARHRYGDTRVYARGLAMVISYIDEEREQQNQRHRDLFFFHRQQGSDHKPRHWGRACQGRSSCDNDIANNLRKEILAVKQSNDGKMPTSEFFGHLGRLYKRQHRQMDFLLQQELNCDADGPYPDYFGINSLHEFAMGPAPRGDLPSGFRTLLRDKALLNGRDICLWTPLHYLAVQRDRSRGVSIFLKSGADSTLSDLRGYTPMHYACAHGSIETVHALLVSDGLAAQGIDGATPIHLAAQYGRKDILKDLRAHSDPNVSQAFEMGDYSGQLPIHWAVRHGRTELIEVFRSQVNQQDHRRWSPLHLASLLNKPEMIELLRSAGASLESRSFGEATPLHYACWNASWDAARLLLKLGAQHDARDAIGRIHLHYAIASHDGSSRIETFLDILRENHLFDEALKATCSLGNTALLYAAKAMNLSAVAALLDAGADPNAVNNDGETLLHLATSPFRPSVDEKDVLGFVQDLVALPNIPDFSHTRDRLGRTAAETARERSRPDVAAFLRVGGK